MYTRVPAEKKPDPYLGGGNKNKNREPPERHTPVKKPNVRSADYRVLMQFILSNPDSITQEEFMLFQKDVGYQQALRVMEEGRRRKQLQKLGVPSPDASIKNGETNKQEEENTRLWDGLPEKLKNGLENLSGVSLSDVKIHKNSKEPQKIDALAYTHGTDIHIAPGQEKYLPHEGWHAVQQKQGRVKSEIQLKTGAAVNADLRLEREADVMGARAEKEGSENGMVQSWHTNEPKSSKIGCNVIQKVSQQEGMELALNNTKNTAKVEDEIKPAGYGEISENVKKIQQVLISMNYWIGNSNDKATGYFGEATKKSLINFQTGFMKLSKYELYDKKGNYVGCGPSTAGSLNSVYKLLNNSNVPEQAKSSIMEIGKNKETNVAYDWDIKAGQYNGYVKEAQLILMSLGHKLPQYGADGKWSSSGETYEALLNFQKSCKNTFDGINKNGTPESRKQVEHLQGIESTGRLDRRTYEALEKQKSKKAATGYNKSPLKKTENDIKKKAGSKPLDANILLDMNKLCSMSANDRIELVVKICNSYNISNSTPNDIKIVKALGSAIIMASEPQKIVENINTAIKFQLNLGTNNSDPELVQAFADVFTAYIAGKIFEGVKLPTQGTPRTWTSTDKYVGETANAIEAKYPGKVVDVNKKVYRADGTPLTDYDIELNNAIIQVKQGGGKGATKQAINTASSTSKEVIVYLPDQNTGTAVVKGLQKEGFKVFTNQQDLLNYLK